MIIDVALVAGTSILSGASSGRQLFAKLISSVPTEPSVPEPIFLDFQRVKVATASFLRESVFSFRSFVREKKSNFYPAIANAGSDVIDEIFELTQSRNDVIMACVIDENENIIRCKCIGNLDPMQELTFNLVISQKETTASKLMNLDSGSVKITAWNNRLASLSNLGLICEQAYGRTKVYRHIFSGGSYGR